MRPDRVEYTPHCLQARANARSKFSKIAFFVWPTSTGRSHVSSSVLVYVLFIRDAHMTVNKFDTASPGHNYSKYALKFIRHSGKRRYQK